MSTPFVSRQCCKQFQFHDLFSRLRRLRCASRRTLWTTCGGFGAEFGRSPNAWLRLSGINPPRSPSKFDGLLKWFRFGRKSLLRLRLAPQGRQAAKETGGS